MSQNRIDQRMTYQPSGTLGGGGPAGGAKSAMSQDQVRGDWLWLEDHVAFVASKHRKDRNHVPMFRIQHIIFVMPSNTRLSSSWVLQNLTAPSGDFIEEVSIQTGT
ncbi:hypothetical protein KC356_g246 [Hortaea werneckii]|nr:hypothetical protein KC356_g246 [Hortaea werneckii]